MNQFKGVQLSAVVGMAEQRCDKRNRVEIKLF